MPSLLSATRSGRLSNILCTQKCSIVAVLPRPPWTVFWELGWPAKFQSRGTAVCSATIALGTQTASQSCPQWAQGLHLHSMRQWTSMSWVACPPAWARMSCWEDQSRWISDRQAPPCHIALPPQDGPWEISNYLPGMETTHHSHPPRKNMSSTPSDSYIIRSFQSLSEQLLWSLENDALIGKFLGFLGGQGCRPHSTHKVH